MNRPIFFTLFFLSFSVFCLSQPSINKSKIKPILKTGAEQTDLYFPVLSGKSVGLVINQTSQINGKALPDSLIKAGIRVIKIFAPEHGFRGIQDAGETINDTLDTKTGLPVISLYGDKKKPSPDDLKGIDLMVFDIQDVGVRFYTYLSTLHYIMEACAENNIPLILLDRPNPNGFYIDGPVMQKKYNSFAGLHPVPIVYGMTIGEYARMINEEGWLKNGIRCSLNIVPLQNYDHKTLYKLPVYPSPNLPDMASVYLYPSLGLFEGTIISVGRGTEKPFHVYGHPLLKETPDSFTPRSIPGKSKYPPYEGQLCKGYDVGDFTNFLLLNKHIFLFWMMDSYKKLKDKNYFNNYFNYLAGNAQLKEQIIKGVPEEKIYKSWESDLNKFKAIRKKYLLYPDFIN